MTEINMTSHTRIIFADYSEIDALKEKLFNKETSPFFIGGEYDEWRNEQIEQVIDNMTLGKIKEILNKIGIPNIISLMKKDYGDEYVLDIFEDGIDTCDSKCILLSYIITKHIMVQEFLESLADMIQTGDWSDEEEEVDSDEASDAETDEEY
jgi:hypothetical protein